MAAQTSWVSEVLQSSITDPSKSRMRQRNSWRFLRGIHDRATSERNGSYLMNRRGFLQLTGATGAAALTASCNRINSVACVRNRVGKQPASLAHAVSIRTSCSTGWHTALAVAFVVGLFYVTYNCHVWQSRCLFQLCREMQE